MNSPLHALAWEVWARNRRRFVSVGCVLVVFAAVYPAVCSWAGIGSSGHDAFDLIAERISPPGLGRPSLAQIVRLLALVFLACSPLAFMVLSILAVAWSFSGAELQLKSGNLVAFPARRFSLPVSTWFLWLWLTCAGEGAVALVYFGWTRLVRLPSVEAVSSFQNCFVWLALLVSSQAVLWSLDNWHVTRALMLNVVLLVCLALPGLSKDVAYFHDHFTGILVALMGVSGAVSYAGLVRIRHGRWRESWWSWDKAAGRPAVPAAGTAAQPFASATGAQFWFEWRAIAMNLALGAAVSAWTALIIIRLVVVLCGPLKLDSAEALTLALMGLPPLVFGLYGLSPGKKPGAFQYVRPAGSGELFLAKAKALALAAALACVSVWAAAALLAQMSVSPERINNPPFHGFDVRSLFRPEWIGRHPILFLVGFAGFNFATWGLAAGNLCFGLTGRRWPSRVPNIAGWALTTGLLPAIFFLCVDETLRRGVIQLIPEALLVFAAAKLALAVWAFRAALGEGLLARSAAIRYAAVWSAMTLALVLTAMQVLRAESAGGRALLEVSTAVILLLPLARIGLGPVALDWGRHESGGA